MTTEPDAAAAEVPAELGQVVERRFRMVKWLAAAVAVAALLIAALGYAVLASTRADHARQAVAGSCGFYRDISIIPIEPAPPPRQALLIIIADARVAYETAGCEETHGLLPAPDDRVRPFIQDGFH